MTGHVFLEGFPHPRHVDGSLLVQFHPFAIQRFDAEVFPSKPPVIAVEIDADIKPSYFGDT
jgi:hypothetical protein